MSSYYLALKEGKEERREGGREKGILKTEEVNFFCVISQSLLSG